MMARRLSSTIIIPNWQGKTLLKKSLPEVLKVGADEIIVVDDASVDGSVQFLKEEFPQVQVLENQKNKGFPFTVNKGVSATSADIVLIFNPDVVPHSDILKHILKHFREKSVFGVSLNERRFSWSRPKLEHGFLGHQPGQKTNLPHDTFWVSGGSGAFRRSMWNELGGMDTLFSPFYWEDVDLSYRALKRGWRLVWEPRAVVDHKHESVINPEHFSNRYLNTIKERNQLLFHWKNLNWRWLLTSHFLGIVGRLRHPGYVTVILSAIVQLPFVLKRRYQERGCAILSDRSILEKFV
ncbi:hypothetical protein CMO96_02455 [Candidatus Woesebacteria bacterium]|nr:hypothetical protein [Candidatus Woesebacteria bacterium]